MKPIVPVNRNPFRTGNVALSASISQDALISALSQASYTGGNIDALRPLLTALGVSIITPPQPFLLDLSLAANTIAETSAAGTIISGILNKTAGSTLSLVDTAGGRFALSGGNLVAGATSTDFEVATSHQITLRETLGTASNTPRDTVLTVNVTNQFEQPSLTALGLSSLSFTTNTAANGFITGATAGSTISAANLPAGLTINGAARTWAWTGTGAVGDYAFSLTETLGDSANSPRTTNLVATVGTAPANVNLTVAQANDNIALNNNQAIEYYMGASRFTHGIFANAGQITARAAGQWYWGSILRPNVWGPAFHDDNYTPRISATQTGGAYLSQDGTGYLQLFQRMDKALASDAHILIINSPLAAVGQASLLDGSPFSVASYVAQMQYIIDYLIAGNAKLPASRRKYLIVDELWERGSSTGGFWAVGASGRTLTQAINNAMKAMLDQRGVPMLPVRNGITRLRDNAVIPGLTDTAGTYTPNFEPMPGVTRADSSVSAPTQTGDTTHLSNIGGKRYADIKDAFYDNLGLAPKRAVLSPTRAGNLLGNGMFTGTGGTLTNANASFSGQLADGYTATRAGTTSASVVTFSKVTKVPNDQTLFGTAPLTMQQISIDTSANGASDREGIDIVQTLDVTGLAAGYYELFAIVEVDGWAGWRNIFGSAASPNFGSSTRKSTTMLTSINSGGSTTGNTSTDSMPMPPEAWTGLLRGHTFETNGTTAQVRFSLGWTKATGVGTMRITGFQLRAAVPSDPKAVEYDESLPATASITSPSAYSFPEETPFSIQCTADKLGRWSLSGTDVNSAGTTNVQFTIDDFGKITPSLGSLDFEGPTDANGDNVYQLTVTFTPFDRRVAPVTQNLSITITNIDDGFSDNFNRADNTPLANGSDGWTRLNGTSTAAVTLSGQLRIQTLDESVYLAPQQGNTRRQRVSFRQRSSGASVGGHILNAVDENNWLGLRVSNASTVTMLVRTAGTVTAPTTWTPWKPVALGQLFQSQIEVDPNDASKEIMAVYQDSVKLALASGSADVTTIHAAARRGGVVARGTTGTATIADDWNIRVAAPIVQRVGLKALVWDVSGTTTTTVAAGAIFVASFAGRKTPNSDVSLTETRLNGVLADPTTFFSDGDVVRSLGGQTVGTWTFVLTERLPNADDRITTMTVNVT